MKPTLFKKLLFAMVAVSLVPLLVASAILFVNLENTRDKMAEQAAVSADQQASLNLEMRAREVALDISRFLGDCETDLRLAASFPLSTAILKAFYDNRQGEIWYQTGPLEDRHEVREKIPRYSSLELTDRHGKQIFVIKHGRVLPTADLKDISLPANTEFRSEDYFVRTSRLKKGEIYVSHLTGFHLSKQEQLAGADQPEHASGGRIYEGVIRFAMPLFDQRGNFNGIVALALDHRHLMEFSQHILPGKEGFTVFPSYQSGNYAFIFDDQGWIITHPKYWDIRGVDLSGKLLPPYTATSSPRDVESGRIPFNLDQAGFIHINYPVVARQVRKGLTGHVDITNVGGAEKLMAFAPIPYSTGDYGKYGIFGAVTIGFQADQFRESARSGVSLMSSQLKNHLRLSSLIIALSSLIAVFSAWLLSRGMSRPLAVLADGARRVANGETGQPVEVTTGGEIGQLASDFNRMAEELEARKQRLLNTLEELRDSRQEILAERNFKSSILESISSAILTLSPEGLLTSINATGRQILGPGAVLNSHYSEFLSDWAEVPGRISTALADAEDYGRRPLVRELDGKSLFYDVGVFPIGDAATNGITVTIRDETEKEKLREEMLRMDRFASLGKLSAGIAHEVRNPLTGVSLLLDDLHDREAHDPESQSMMRKALAEIERVEKLIAALLNFSSPPKADFRQGELNRVVQDTLLLLRRECEKHGVDLEFSPGNVPEFCFDIEKIKQALLNLVKNSLDALHGGGKIRVTTTANHESSIITVSDNGPGIAEDDLPLIFEPFFTSKGAGTGLGLSITQRIVEEHHGKITVATGNESGTTFTIELPITTAVFHSSIEASQKEQHGKNTDN